jgi:hypothetical protein
MLMAIPATLLRLKQQNMFNRGTTKVKIQWLIAFLTVQALYGYVSEHHICFGSGGGAGAVAVCCMLLPAVSAQRH